MRTLQALRKLFFYSRNNNYSRMAFRGRSDSRCISSIVSKQFLRSDLVNFGNSQKLNGAKLDGFGHCGTICIKSSAFCVTLNASATEISFGNIIRHYKNRRMHFWRRFDMKFVTDVCHNAANLYKKNVWSWFYFFDTVVQYRIHNLGLGKAPWIVGALEYLYSGSCPT